MASAAQEDLRPVLGEIHRYWFGELRSPTDLPEDRKEMWFKQSDATDAHIKEHFTGHIAEAALLDWDVEALSREEQAGLVVLLDQFPRNSFRNSPEAYAYDPKARSIAGRLIDGGMERFALIERMFLAIPFEHSETIADQDYSVWLMAGIAVAAKAAFPEYARWALDSFIVHRDFIRRFGRFPHRNAALGRASTEEEAVFLAAMGRVNVSNPTEGASLGSQVSPGATIRS
jgi:uncharacterized protein (DUF924 family)